jgi:hypothetical protein
MARTTLIALFLFVAALLLAFALFVAGAIWRGRVTSGTTDFRTHEGLVFFAVARDWAYPPDSGRFVGYSSIIRLRHSPLTSGLSVIRPATHGRLGTAVLKKTS